MTTLLAAALFAEPRIARADRADAREHVRVGQTLEAAGARIDALERYEKAISSDPDLGLAYELALPLWMAEGREKSAMAALEKLTLRCPECGFAWYALGALYRRAGRYVVAVMAYDAYLSRKPQDADAVFGRAMALAALEDRGALRAFERYVELEMRPEREPYRREAQRRIRELGGKPQVPPAALATFARLHSWLAPGWRILRSVVSGRSASPASSDAMSDQE